MNTKGVAPISKTGLNENRKGLAEGVNAIPHHEIDFNVKKTSYALIVV